MLIRILVFALTLHVSAVLHADVLIDGPEVDLLTEDVLKTIASIPKKHRYGFTSSPL